MASYHRCQGPSKGHKFLVETVSERPLYSHVGLALQLIKIKLLQFKKSITVYLFLMKIIFSPFFFFFLSKSLFHWTTQEDHHVITIREMLAVICKTCGGWESKE